MSYEISRALEAHNALITEFMYAGGEAVHAQFGPSELPKPITHPRNATYTHTAIQCSTHDKQAHLERGHANPYRPGDEMHFSPELTVALTDPEDPDADVYNVTVHYASFTLNAAHTNGAAVLPRSASGLLIPQSYRIGRAPFAFEVIDDLELGMFKDGASEKTREVVRAGQALRTTLNMMSNLGAKGLKKIITTS